MVKTECTPDLTLERLEDAVFEMYKPVVLGGERTYDLSDVAQMQDAFDTVSRMSGLSIRTVMRYGEEVRASMANCNDFAEAMRRGEYAG